MRKKDRIIIAGAALATLAVIALKRKASGQALMPELRELWGGGMPTMVPQTIVDYYGGRSVAEVLEKPGPLFQREVLDYRGYSPSPSIR